MRTSDDGDASAVLLGVFSDIAEESAKEGDVEAVINVASRIYESAFREYVALNGEGDMGEFFLDWANDYECGGFMYMELIGVAKSNSWKRV